jgi:hypothetical protein
MVNVARTARLTKKKEMGENAAATGRSIAMMGGEMGWMSEGDSYGDGALIKAEGARAWVTHPA